MCEGSELWPAQLQNNKGPWQDPLPTLGTGFYKQEEMRRRCPDMLSGDP